MWRKAIKLRNTIREVFWNKFSNSPKISNKKGNVLLGEVKGSSCHVSEHYYSSLLEG